MKRTFQKLLVMLTVMTMLFSSVPFAFAEDNEPSENEVLSTDLVVEEEIIDPDTDSDANVDVDMDTPADDTEDMTDTNTDSENEEPENGDSEQPAAPLAPAVPEAPMDGDPEHVHTEGDRIIEKASFDKDGSMKKLCTECGEVLEEEAIPMVSEVSFDADPAAYIYEGEPITPAITVKTQDIALTQDKDYKITFSNNNKVGKATAKVTLQGEKYSGTKDFQFAILSDKLKRVNLLVGESKNASIDASVTEALGSDISFSIDDPSIATVDANGKVTGVAAGKTVLNAVVGGFTFKADVTVIKKLEPTLLETSATYDEDLEEYEYDWVCSYDFTYDGTEGYRVVVNKAWTDYEDPCKAEVILWDSEAELDDNDDNDIIKRVVLKNGKGTVNFDSSYFKAYKDYEISVWCYYDDDDFEDCTYVDAAIYSVPFTEAIAFEETNYEMMVGDTQTIAFKSDGGDTGAVKWSTSNTSVATVSKGTVTAKGPGECTITAKINGVVADQCTVKVTKYEELKFPKASYTIYGTTPLKLTLVNQSAIYDEIKWKTSNTTLATVDDYGKLTPKKAGTVTVTASAEETGKEATCKVTIKAKLKKKSVSIYMKKTTTNKLLVAPAKVYWSSSNKKVATVSSTGKITGQKPGTCTITAKCKGVKYTCKVTVKKFKLSKTSVRLGRNKKITLKVTGGSGTIKWKTSNKKVATVSSKGVVKGVNPGTCYISATRNGSTVKCKITVYRVRPNFGAYVYDYDTRNNRFIVKFKNKGQKTLYITSGIDVEQFNYRTFDRYISLSKTVAIAPGKSKLVYFKVKGSITYWDYETFNLYYHFKYDGKKYTGVTWNEGSEYKVGKKWPATYKDEDWYYEWDAY